MHEFEDLVEQSVVLLAANGRSASELRSRYWNRYEFQARWDTKVTHFRVMDHLLAARFVYRVPLADHPNYADYREYFDSIGDFAWVEKPVAGEGGYVSPPHLYFDAGSRLWRRMVDARRLGGDDADPPQEMDLAQIASETAALAETVGDVDLIAWWYRSLAFEMFMQEPQVLAANSWLRQLRDVVRRSRALDVELSYHPLAVPGAETLGENPRLVWWFDLDS
jgi:hypothetical protein